MSYYQPVSSHHPGHTVSIKLHKHVSDKHSAINSHAPLLHHPQPSPALTAGPTSALHFRPTPQQQHRTICPNSYRIGLSLPL